LGVFACSAGTIKDHVSQVMYGSWKLGVHFGEFGMQVLSGVCGNVFFKMGFIKFHVRKKANI
jgi:hypothetical protein